MNSVTTRLNFISTKTSPSYSRSQEALRPPITPKYHDRKPVCRTVLQPQSLEAKFIRTLGERTTVQTSTEPSVTSPKSSSQPARLTPHQMKFAQTLMLENLSRKITVREFAKRCGISPSHFLRAFRDTCGTTPYQWVLQQRIKLAKRLLATSHLTLPEIALECGFAHREPFTKAFARITGCGPSKWRRDYQSSCAYQHFAHKTQPIWPLCETAP